MVLLATHPLTFDATASAEEKVRLAQATIGYPALESAIARDPPTNPDPTIAIGESSSKFIFHQISKSHLRDETNAPFGEFSSYHRPRTRKPPHYQ